VRHQVIPLLARTDYDFSSLPTATRITNLPLVQNVDISQWGTGTLVVRLHSGTDLKAFSSFRVDARAVAPSDEDPGAFFRGRIIGTVQQSSVGLNPPSLLHTRLADNAGGAMSLFLTVDQVVTNDLVVTISIDLIVQERALGWTPAELGSKLTLWLDQRDQFAVSGVYSDWGDQTPGGTLDFTQIVAGKRPAAGVGINDFSAPSFDGVDDYLLSDVLSKFISAASYHVFVVLRARTVSGSNATAYLNNGVVADVATGWWGLYLKDNAGTYEAHGFHWDSGLSEAVATGLALNEDSLVEWSFDGTDIRCQIGTHSEAIASASNVGNLTNAVALGVGASGGLYLDGAIGSVLVCNVHLTETERVNVRGYLSSLYGVPA